MGVVPEFCVKNDDAFAHDCHDCEDGFFAVLDQALIEISRVWIEPARRHSERSEESQSH